MCILLSTPVHSRSEVLIGVPKKYVHCQDFYTLMFYSIKYLAGAA